MSLPAGWYDDGSGRRRWWDGAQWTNVLEPSTTAPPPHGYPGQTVQFIGIQP